MVQMMKCISILASVPVVDCAWRHFFPWHRVAPAGVSGGQGGKQVVPEVEVVTGSALAKSLNAEAQEVEDWATNALLAADRTVYQQLGRWSRRRQIFESMDKVKAQTTKNVASRIQQATEQWTNNDWRDFKRHVLPFVRQYLPWHTNLKLKTFALTNWGGKAESVHPE